MVIRVAFDSVASGFVVNLRTMLIIGILTAAIELVVAAGEADSNPDCLAFKPCECEVDSDRLVVNCNLPELLDDIPRFQPTNAIISELNLADNNIRSIPSLAFAGLRIVRLDLTGNSISQFEPDSFVGLDVEILNELRLELNVSTNFPIPALSVLVGLKSLYIQGFRASPSLPPNALSAFIRLESLTLTGKSTNPGVLPGARLEFLTANDFAAQKTTLSSIDLSYNQLPAVPTAALANLLNLTTLDLMANKITTIDAVAFSSIRSSNVIQNIDLSYNSIATLDKEAFVPLATSLRSLSMIFCVLTNSHLDAIRQLKSLNTLNIENNRIISVDVLIDHMRSLQVLNARMNQIATLSARSFSLKSLNLQLNPLAINADNAFSQLGALEELYIDSSTSIQLSSESFATQQQKLRVLNIRNPNADASTLPWSAFSGLTALQVLSLTTCSFVGAVPDFTFASSINLQKIDLSGNKIEVVSQRSLAGLQNSLVGISLSTNSIQTLDRCLFDKFAKIDIFQIDLNNNPLHCDCNLMWLYKWLKQYRGKDDRFWTLMWNCSATVNNGPPRLFVQLNDNDFASCPPISAPSPPCEDLAPTTVAAPITSRPSAIVLRVNQTLLNSSQPAQSCLYAWWSIPNDMNMFSLTLTVRNHNSDLAIQHPIATPDYDGRYVFTDLAAGTTYEICIYVATTALGTMDACTTGLTQPVPSSAGLMLGVAVGGTVTVLLIVGVVVWCCLAAKRRQRAREKEMQKLAEATTQKHNGQVKRFRKQKTSMTGADTSVDGGAGAYGYGGAGVSAATITDEDIDRALVSTVEKLDPHSKDLLASLLRSASAASLNQLDGGTYVRSGARSYDGYNKGDTGEEKPHIYEDLPDEDTYDTIPTDDYV